MIIKRLVLENFISHSHTEVDFTPGVNIIVGHNGSGKSSMIDAIKLALFGDSRGNIQEMVKKGERESSVYLEFSMGGSDYSILRTISLGKSGHKGDAFLKKGDSLMAQTIKGVSLALKDVLGITKEIALNSVFVEQGQIDSLISSERAVRERTFSSILDLDVLSESAAALRDLARDYDMRIGGVTYTDEDLDAARSRMEITTEEIAALENALQKISGDLSILREREMVEDEKLADLRKRETALINIRARIEATRNRRKKLEDEIAKISADKEKIESGVAQLKNSNFQKILENEADIDNLLQNTGKIGILEKNLAEMENTLRRITESSAKMASLEEKAKLFRSAYEELSRLEKETAQLQETYMKNAASRQRIARLNAEIKKTQSLIGDLDGRLRSSLKIGNDDSLDLLKIETDLEKRQKDIHSEIVTAQREMSALETRKESLTQRIHELDGKNICPLCNQPLTENHLEKLISQANDEDKIIMNAMKKAQDRIRELGNDQENISRMIRFLRSEEPQNYISARKRISEQNHEVQELQQEIDSTMEGSEKYVRLSDEMRSKREIVQDTQKDAAEYDKLRNFIEENPPAMIEEAANSIRKELLDLRKMENRMRERIDFRTIDELQDILRKARKSRNELDLEEEKIRSREADLRSRIEEEREADEEIRSLVKDIAAFEAVPQEIEKQNLICKDIRQKISGLSSEIAANEATLSSRKEVLSDYGRQLSEIEESMRMREKLKRTRSIIQRMRECFDRDGIQKIIRQSATEFISNKMREYISMFGLRFDDISVHEDMDVEVLQDGVLEPLSMLSGGERTAISIGLRLAIARYLSENINTIIMDEPTNFLDEERRNSLKDIIRNAFINERAVPQMIIVTHHSELTAASDSTITVTKEGGSSVVSTLF